MSDSTEVFVEHRELLFSVVYGMLGTVADTEDVLQETFLSWASRSGGPVENERAYLVRIAVHQALARRAAIGRRKETYVGQWLPEPLVEEDGDPVVRAESYSMALLVVLETLTPLERAVFVLHEVFGYAHTEIAEILGRRPAAIRQLAHRAREHVHARRPRYRADPKVCREVTKRFLDAVVGGDLEALLRALAPDVTLWTDGGGKGPAWSPHPVHGRERVAKLFAAIHPRVLARLDVRHRRAGGDSAAVLFVDGSPLAVFVLDLTPYGDRVSRIYSITNPDKLPRIG
ncbi:sigma-70 family RNA polymerase sigma factor [Streptomyces sp. 8K308]|uniref:sigma-70 family RNA polymerase sigma factor n=1 Tax=Streptomyces sp. 8K308 TaxID=2530388 RepID=UPI001046C4EA|nr:sigma-70 family RNA polymerase sigma factor [Streptomyces sp. 8K308]TDC19507.1 sigma-70 family RNA polymerase sigma factor [Streptomyces sp. 8K308]